MKVTRTANVGAAEPTEGTRRPTKQDGEFGQVFQDELAQITAANQAIDRQEPGVNALPVATVGVYGLDQPQVKEPEKVERAVEATIDGLDRVGQLLGDATVTPRKMQDAIHTLTAQAAELRTSMQALPADHPLQRLATEVSVLATVESIKWNRGDYL